LFKAVKEAHVLSNGSVTFRPDSRQHLVWEACHRAEWFTSWQGAKEQKHRNQHPNELPWKPISKGLETPAASYLLHVPSPSSNLNQETKSITYWPFVNAAPNHVS
jgi:hypothetical protein